MKILWVKPGKLLPLDSGGKLRTYNILRALCKRHEVTLLTYYHGRPDVDYEKQIAQHIPGAFPVCTGVTEPAGMGRYADYLRRLMHQAPYAVSRFEAGKVTTLVEQWLNAFRFDVAICDFLASAPNFPMRLATPSVLFQHNVESVLWSRRAQFERNPLDRFIAKLESAKMIRYETRQVRRFHHVLAVSEQDRQAMSAMVDLSRVGVVPTGVDLSTYAYDPEVRPAGPLVVFTGSMDWEPNIDGVEFFCRSVWPRVMERIPDARFLIVGRDPHPRVKKLTSMSVEVTGTVPSITSYLRDAAVLVVPLRIGSGTRIKIYEGMAMGKATVSTSVGAEGLDVRNGHDIMLADDPMPFAEAVVNLLLNEDLRRNCEAAAAATARKYDWSIVVRKFVEELEKAIQTASASTNTAAPAARTGPVPAL